MYKRQVQKAYAFNNLQEFLDIYYQGMSVLQNEEDFYELTKAYMKRVAQDGCVHAEIFFDPQGHTERGVAFEPVIEGILRGLEDSEKEFGISSELILSFLRHLSEESAFETLHQATPYLDRILGVGLDSSELGHPPSKFEQVFKAARQKGLKSFSHGGEEGPPDYVKEALDLLDIDRLDHGNRSLEDDELTARLVKEEMVLTVCPLSNLKLCVVDNLEQHPLKKMLDLGLKVTVNSDDPSYFGGYLADNFRAVTDALMLTGEELKLLARNSILGSYMDENRKTKLLLQIDGCVP